MNTKTINGELVKDRTQLHKELDLIENQITELKDLIEKSESEKSKLEIKKDTIILDDFPIKLGDKVITKKEQSHEQLLDYGSEDGGNLFVLGEVIKIHPYKLGDCLIDVFYEVPKGLDGKSNIPRFDEKYYSFGSSLRDLSLEDFNELFQVIKN